MYALLSCEINEYKCFTGEQILPSEQSRIIEQNNFNYTPLRKTKNTKEQEKNKLKHSWPTTKIDQRLQLNRSFISGNYQ